jgi:hypothetical protein
MFYIITAVDFTYSATSTELKSASIYISSRLVIMVSAAALI